MNNGLRIHGVVCNNAYVIDKKTVGGVHYVLVHLDSGRTYWYEATEVIRYAYHPSISMSDPHDELLRRLGGRGR